MTILRPRPVPRYYAFFVRPIGEFNPTCFLDRPAQFRIIEQVGTMHLRGKIDAWRFMANDKAMADGTAQDRWAIALS